MEDFSKRNDIMAVGNAYQDFQSAIEACGDIKTECLQGN